MPVKKSDGAIENILSALAGLVPEYAKNPEDKAKSGGNCAVCILEEDGTVHGKMFGEDRNKVRNLFRVAWLKASQTWITGMKTGEYEKKVFNNEVDADRFPILSDGRAVSRSC